MSLNLKTVRHLLFDIRVKWYDIGLELDVAVGTLDSIRSRYHDDPRDCLREMLKEWLKSISPPPTWKRLATALSAVDEKSLAQKLEASQHESSNSDTISKKQPNEPVRLHVEPDEDDTSAGVFKENLARIKGSFATLVTRITDKLKNINIGNFRLYVTTLYPPGDFMSGATTVAEICEALSRHRLWDYSYFSPIDEIAKKYAKDDLEIKGWIKDYKSELAGFKATTKIVDFIKACEDEDNIADPDQPLNLARYDKRYCSKLTIKLKERVTEKSLDYIDELWRSVADHFVLPCLSVLLDSIKEGCVEVTWCVPTPYAFQIQTNIEDSTEFLQQKTVMQVVMDDEILYDEEGMDMKLLQACEKGDIDKMVALLTYGIDVNTADSKQDGATPLLVAARKGNYRVAELLLNYNASIDKGDFMGYTPLLVAALNGHLLTVQILLEQHADVSISAKDGWTALSCACYNGHLEVAKVLLLHNADVNAHTEMGWTPLMYAIEQKEENLEMVKLLLDAGAVINKEDMGDNVTPLVMACKKGSLDLIDLLMKYGASVHTLSKNGMTAMHVACKEGHLDLVKFLCAQGASIKTASRRGCTPLMLACMGGYVNIAEYLLEQDSSLLNHCTLQSGCRWSPLMFACNEGHTVLVAKLISLGANTDDFTQESGLSALILATVKGYVEVVKLLLEARANVHHAEKNSGWSALFFAAKKGNLAIVKLLLEYGADMWFRAKVSDVTAYDVASIEGQTEVCDEFEEHGYQSLAPPTENMRREVEQSNLVLSQHFLDMENIHTFRDVLSDRDKHTEEKRLGSGSSNNTMHPPWEPHM